MAARRKVVAEQAQSNPDADMKLDTETRLEILFRIADKYNHSDIRAFAAQIAAEKAAKATDESA